MKQVNRYRITNTSTGEVKEKEAEYLAQAVQELGWDIADCQCEIVPAKKKSKKQAKQAPAEVSEPQSEVQVVAEAEKVAEEFCQKLETEIAEAEVKSIVNPPTEAEKEALGHKQQIEALAIEAEVMFLRMGQLLYNAREKGEWTVLHYESYREYVEDLKLPMTNSYSWATRLSSIYEYLVKKMGLDEKLLAEIGVAKLTRLLPLARKGELTQEVIEAARLLSDLDLRASLGHDVGGGDTEDIIICPRCGNQFDAKKASRV